jgi:DNA-binding protein H-NS
MSVDALLKLRDDIGSLLGRRAGELRQQLARLGGEAPSRGGRGRRAKGSLKGRKVAPKFRGPGGETWAGRGARPKWLAALLQQGRKLEEFAIGPGGPAKRAASRRKSAAKRSPRKRK